MKRIICVLITLFTFIGSQANAQINVNIGSASGAVGDIVLIPVSVQFPTGSQDVDAMTGALQLTDPTVAQIIGFTNNQFVYPALIGTDKVGFVTNNVNPVVDIEGVIITLQVKINNPGCTDIVLTDISSQASLEFVVDGNVYDDPATDFSVTNGKACSSCDVFIQNLQVYESNQAIDPNFTNPSGNSISSPVDYTAACIPHSAAPFLKVTGSQANIYLAIYVDNDNNGSFETTIYSGLASLGGINIPLPTGFINHDAPMRIIASDQPITDPTAIPSCGEMEDYVFCGDCLCDLNDIDLGPLSYTPSTTDCSIITIAVPAVTGCSSVEDFDTYLFEIYNSNGVLQNFSNSNWIQHAFVANGTYTIVVTYTIVDISGCEQTVILSEDFEFNGCGGCPCDPNDLVLGPITVTPSTTGLCDQYTISVPDVTGCEGLLINSQYIYTLVDAWGNNVPFTHTSPTTIVTNLPYQAQFFVDVQFNYFTGDEECDGKINEGTSFFYAGCDCQTMSLPTNLLCNPGINPLGGGQLLTWDAVPAAFSYDIQIVYNDPKCCTTIGPIQSVIMISTNNWLNMSAATCFSWRVRGECANGTKTAWSPVSCSCKLTGGHGGSKSALQSDGERIADESLKLTAVPNPASNQVNITLTGWSNEIMINQPEIIIYEISGKVVYQSEIAMDETKTVDLSSFTSGVYIINIIDNNVLLSTEKLIVE